MKKLLLVVLLLITSAVFGNQEPVTYLDLSPAITRQEVVNIYTMRTRFWKDGTRITVVYQGVESTAHKEFCEYILQITPTRFSQLIDLYLNSGNAAYYVKVDNERQAYDKIVKNYGAVTYLSNHWLLVNGAGCVKKIRIID